jgi:hypothetical protein
MLIIASDIHLSDGTCSKSISPSAFYLFADRLGEIARHASWRRDNRYRPIQQIDLVLLGDILDPIHSTRWLDTAPGDPTYVRPWSDPHNPVYARKLKEVTAAIIAKNKEGIGIFKKFSDEQMIELMPAVRGGVPAKRATERIIPKVRIHYMIGNHDWYYGLPGAAFDAIREEINDAIGLSNSADPFPYEIESDSVLNDLFAQYRVFGRHGDYYDKFNYDPEQGRSAATLGDAFAMDVLNRYPVEVEKRLGNELPPGIVDSLRKLVNVRPALATSLWISGQIKRYAGNPALEEELKRVWDDICDEFLESPFVRSKDRPFLPDAVDFLEGAIKISQVISFPTLNSLVAKIYGKFSEGISYTKNALEEPAFKNKRADFVVYGHTHHHEVVSLDALATTPAENQIYLNSGTWHSYYNLTVKNPEDEKFIPYQAMTYLSFYKDDERGGRKFEAWSGVYA